MKLSDKSVLYITHSYSSFQKDQIEELAQYFQQVYVLVRYKPVSELSSLLPIPMLKTHKKEFVFQLSGKPDNVTVIPVPLWYLPTSRSYLKLGEKHFKAVLKIITEQNIRFDMVHAHFAWSAGYVGMRIKETYNVPFILTTHRYDIIDLPQRSEKWHRQIKSVINSSDKCITVSEMNLTYLNEITEEKEYKVIVNGYSDKFSSRRYDDIPIDKEPIKVLNVGMLIKRKGHIHLIEAMKSIVEENDAVCYIIGNGKLKGSLEKAIKGYNLEGKVILLGNKPHEEVASWMNGCDIFVLPSFSEGNPTVMFEALGAGKPYVGTAVGGVPEIINSEDYGLLCKPGDSKGLEDQLIKAMGKKWDTQKILDYSEQFSWGNLCREIKAVYEDALSEK